MIKGQLKKQCENLDYDEKKVVDYIETRVKSLELENPSKAL
jgi:hypothetical protein